MNRVRMYIVGGFYCPAKRQVTSGSRRPSTSPPKIKTARAAKAGSGGWNRHRDARTCFKIGGSTLYEQGLLRCLTAKQHVASAHDRRYDDPPFQREGSRRILTMCWDRDWKSKALHCARTHLSLLFLEGRLIFREYTRCYSLRTTR
jgi:hypothetical protein